MAEEILIMSWESQVGTSCRGINWDQHSLSVLRAAVTCVGGPCLASICRHLAQDYRSWSKGMPDLLLWRFHDDYNGEAKLVEVKGPRDRLSEQQRAWLLFLMDCGFNTEVCKVSPAPISTWVHVSVIVFRNFAEELIFNESKSIYLSIIYIDERTLPSIRLRTTSSMVLLPSQFIYWLKALIRLIEEAQKENILMPSAGKRCEGQCRWRYLLGMRFGGIW